MSESLTALYLTNPALASALRRQQYGQQLAQTGTDTSPTGWAGALARLANAYVGAREVGKADTDIKSLGDAQAASRAQADAQEKALLFPGSGPAGSAPAPVPLPQAPAVAPADPNVPLTDRQNNPGALRFAGQQGATNVGGFAAFPTRDAGMAAADAQLGLYGSRDGINTLAGAISKWAPPNENDTKAYIARVSQATGIDPNAPIDLTDQSIRQKILPAMFGVEGGPKSIAGGARVASNSPPGTATDAGAPVPGAGGGQSPLVAAYLPQQPPTGGAPAQAGGLVPPAIASIPEPMQRAQAIQALALKYSASPDPYLKARAPLLMQMAGQLLQVNKFVPDTVGGVAGQRNVMSGEWKPMVAGTGRTATDAQGNVILIPPGGGAPQTIAPNPSGVTGTSDLANASRALNTIAPKIQAGTATPQDIQNYNTALTLFQGHKTQVDPATNKIIQVPERPLPPGTPDPPAGAHTGATPLTEGGFGAKTAAGIQESQGKDDAKNIAEEQAKIATGHSTLATTQTIRSTLPQVTTGVGADQRLKAQQIFTALGVPDATAKEWTGTSAPMGEILQKKLFELSTGAVRGMGAREPGSVVAMFAKNYPNMNSQNMTIDAMTRLLDMDQTYKEAEIGARGGHLNSSVARLSSGQPYQGMAGYQAPDPRPFQAAALAAGGMPFDVWSRGLDHDQQVAALRLAGHVWPDASALNAKGQKKSLQPPGPASQAPP